MKLPSGLLGLFFAVAFSSSAHAALGCKTTWKEHCHIVVQQLGCEAMSVPACFGLSSIMPNLTQTACESFCEPRAELQELLEKAVFLTLQETSKVVALQTVPVSGPDSLLGRLLVVLATQKPDQSETPAPAAPEKSYFPFNDGLGGI